MPSLQYNADNQRGEEEKTIILWVIAKKFSYASFILQPHRELEHVSGSNYKRVQTCALNLAWIKIHSLKAPNMEWNLYRPKVNEKCDVSQVYEICNSHSY